MEATPVTRYCVFCGRETEWQPLKMDGYDIWENVQHCKRCHVFFTIGWRSHYSSLRDIRSTSHLSRILSRKE